MCDRFAKASGKMAFRLNSQIKSTCSVSCHLPSLGMFWHYESTGSPEKRPPDAQGVESSPGTDHRDTPKRGRNKNGQKKPIPEMKLTVDIQQWLQKENEKAVKIK